MHKARLKTRIYNRELTEGVKRDFSSSPSLLPRFLEEPTAAAVVVVMVRR